MSEGSTTAEQYLKQLRSELEVLGPKEADEVVNDVRALLVDAVAEHDGDESAALEGFGAPGELAQRTLEERAASGEWASVPRAGWWLRAGAMAFDLAVLAWSAQLTASLASVAYVATLSKTSLVPLALGIAGSLFVFALLGVYAVLVVAARRSPGGPSFGMQLFGLRYVRVGAGGRVVRVRSIPGARREWRIGTLVVAMLTAMALYSMGQSFVRWPAQNAASEAHQAVNMAGVSVSVVSDVYRSVLSGESEESADNFAAKAEPAHRALLARHRAGRLASYAVGQVELDGRYSVSGIPNDGPDSYYVTVWEYGSTGAESGQAYRYHVAATWKPAGPNIREGEILVDSVEHTE